MLLPFAVLMESLQTNLLQYIAMLCSHHTSHKKHQLFFYLATESLFYTGKG